MIEHSGKERQKQLEVLRRELKVAGIDIGRFVPAWASSRAICEVVLDELLHALQPAVHEGLIPPYGSAIVREIDQFPQRLEVQPETLALARKAAEGRSALLMSQPDGRRALFFVNDPTKGFPLVDRAVDGYLPDLIAVQLIRESDGVVVLRDGEGCVRLYTSKGVVRYRLRQWAVGPSLTDAMLRVTRAAPMVDQTTLTRILEFAFYVLGPSRIGATLVWLLTDENPFAAPPIDLRPLSCTIGPGASRPVTFAARLLAQHDGATIVAPNGDLLATGVHLTASPEAREFIAEYAGTRHTSARRASFDLGTAIIVTVSADGPVTVFSDGLSVFEYRWYSADDDARSMHKAYGRSVEDSIWTSSHETVCSRCGKTLRVEEMTVAGWRDHEVANCPICGNQVATGHCFQIEANVVKSWPRASTRPRRRAGSPRATEHP